MLNQEIFFSKRFHNKFRELEKRKKLQIVKEEEATTMRY